MDLLQRLKRNGVIALILMFAAVGGAAIAHAQTIAPQPCDPKYWKTLEARAWMEAEREIMQNQNLIFKPDSVLEYTCFDKMVSHGAKHLGDVFVHNPNYFGKMIIQRGQPYSQEMALQSVVTGALVTYMNDNFSNEYFSRRAGSLRNKPAKLNHDAMVPASSQQTYSDCKMMAEVWKAAKCMNFIDSQAFEATDGFYPYTELKPGPEGGQPVKGYDTIGDVRKWPEGCADAVKGQEWTTKNDVAINKDENAGYKFKTPLKTTYEDVRKLVEPGQCNGQGFETGVTVILSGAVGGSGGGGNKDKVCSNPGCTLVGQSCQ